LVDALIDGVAVIIDCILLSSDALRNDCLRFVSNETIHHGVRIGNEVEAMNGELVEASNGAIKRDDVFLEAVVRGRVIGGGSCRDGDRADLRSLTIK
jgi:hypothetical protein